MAERPSYRHGRILWAYLSYGRTSAAAPPESGGATRPWSWIGTKSPQIASSGSHVNPELSTKGVQHAHVAEGLLGGDPRGMSVEDRRDKIVGLAGKQVRLGAD